MNKSGFIRRCILVAALTYCFAHFIVGEALQITDPDLEEFAKQALCGIAAFAVLNGFIQRLRD